MIERLEDVLRKGEGIDIEFKKSKNTLNKDVYETVCAFLNRNGGDLILGVDDNGNIEGIEENVIDKIKNDFITSINNPQKLTPPAYLSIEEFKIEGKLILHVYIPESSQVHKCNGKIFDRNQDGDLDISNSTDLVANMYIRKQKGFSENEIFPYAYMEHLKVELIEKVRKMAVIRNADHPWKDMNNEELLRSAGLIQNDFKTGKQGLTLGCILLFGKDETINSVAPQHKTDAILRQINLDRYDDRDDIRCNLIESYDRLMKFIEKHLSDPFYLDKDVRISVRNNLFREVIANTLIHREYSNHFPAKFIIGNDDVIIENGNKTNGFGEININNFTPFPKNPNIARVFKEIGWADELGSGIKNLIKYCKIYSNSQPVFIEGDIFKTIIEMNRVDKKASDKRASEKNERKKANEKKRTKKIIEYIKENGSINTAKAMEILGLGKTRTYEILLKMANDNIIHMEKAGRGTKYIMANTDE